jgi:glutamate dehydrogenase (NAD(P)+)
MASTRINVLLIEDNPVQAKLIANLLAGSTAPVFELQIAGQLADGLERLEAKGPTGTVGPVDIVLLDLILPDSEDLDTFARVHAAAPNLPVVILTGLDDVSTAAKAVELGAQDYLLKAKLDQAGLRRSIRYAMERMRAGRSEFDSPMFRLAQQQFLKAAQLINLDDNVRQRLLFPQRSQVVTLPFLRDDRHMVENVFAYRVQHVAAMEPTKGSIHFHPEVSLGEVSALAMWTTWKCALLQLAFGGAEGGIRVDPTMLSEAERQNLSDRYMEEVAGVDFPPDNDTPDAARRGLGEVIEEAAKHLAIDLTKATAVVQGFGSVGANAVRFLAGAGTRVLGVSDVHGGVFNEKGIDVHLALAHAADNGTLEGLPGATPISNADLLELECDILAPCAVQNQITATNAERLKCRVLAEGASGATTLEADQILGERDIVTLPHILASAAAFARTLARAQKQSLDMRTAAHIEAVSFVTEANLASGIVR